MKAYFFDNSEKADEMCNEIKAIIEKYGYKGYSILKTIDNKEGFEISVFYNPLLHRTDAR